MPPSARLQKWVRGTHKWISLAVGLQVLLWTIGGLYMVAVPIQTIRGEHLANSERALLQQDAPRLAPQALAAQYPGMTGFTLKQLGGREVYEIAQGKARLLADAQTGARVTLGRDQIAALAAAAYTGSGSIDRIDWLDRAPREVRGRPAPLWAVRFGDPSMTTFYYAPQTGELLARRHSLWRWFDLFWMLHIMDYAEREDINNPLLRGASIASMGTALSGVWLLAYWLRGRWRRRRRA